MLDSTRRHSTIAEASVASYATVTGELQTLWGLVWGNPSADAAQIERPERAELRATFGLHEGNRKERRRARALARSRRGR